MRYPYRVKRPIQEFPSPGKKSKPAFLPVQALSAKQGVNYGGVFLVDNHFGVGTTLGNLALEVRRSTPLALAAQRGFLQGSIGRWLGQSCVARDFGGNPRQL